MKIWHISSLLTMCTALILALGACNVKEDNSSPVTPPDFSKTGYVKAGTEFWNGWVVPQGTVLLGTPFPNPTSNSHELYHDVPQNKNGAQAVFLIVGDAHEVMRDLYSQIEDRDLQPVVEDWNKEVCTAEKNASIWCQLYGQDEDGYTKIEANLMINTTSDESGSARSILTINVGEYSDFMDLIVYDAVTASEMSEGKLEERRTLFGQIFIDAPAPDGPAPVKPPTIDAQSLVSGSPMQFFKYHNRYESTRGIPYAVTSPGDIPDGARLLAPSFNPGSTSGAYAIFIVTENHEQALGEFERIAADLATGDKYPDETVNLANLEMHRISYDGSAGGCPVALDTVALINDTTIVRLDIGCD